MIYDASLSIQLKLSTDEDEALVPFLISNHCPPPPRPPGIGDGGGWE